MTNTLLTTEAFWTKMFDDLFGKNPGSEKYRAILKDITKQLDDDFDKSLGLKKDA